MLLAVGLAQALAEHHTVRPAVPFLVDLVGELVDQIGVQVSDQRRYIIGNQANLVLVGGLGPLSGLAEQAVDGLELGHGLVQGIGAFTYLLGQHHGMLKRRIGIVAPGYPRLDAFDQRTVDPLQLLVFVLQPGDLGLQFSARQEAGCGQWRPR